MGYMTLRTSLQRAKKQKANNKEQRANAKEQTTNNLTKKA